jgi:predicted O-linked N-acetylglucosamine transferase (SPINDLY family)
MEFNQREAILLSAMCSIGILLSGYSMLVKPQLKTLEETSSGLAEATSAVKTLEAEQMGLNQDVGRGKSQYNENKAALSFAFENKDLESRMKGFMRVLSNITTQTGNQLITIQPYGGEEGDSASKTQNMKEEGEKANEIPEALQRFKTVKEQDLPLYSTKMELKIRGNFAQVKKFIETLANFKKELVQVETMYLSYEGLGERLMTNFSNQDSSKKSDPARHVNRPLLLVTRLKFYLMEPNENTFDQAVEELKAQKEEEEANTEDGETPKTT